MRLWTYLTCNWFTLGLICHTKGHYWRDETITIAPNRVIDKVRPGVIQFVPDGKRAIHKVRYCGRCGNYRGKFTKVID